uniref:Uncharacterized protein n=1 Tax=Sipha flava TaxID=143950 RepID=A0A2S2Q9S3_9HEMI
MQKSCPRRHVAVDITYDTYNTYATGYVSQWSWRNASVGRARPSVRRLLPCAVHTIGIKTRNYTSFNRKFTTAKIKRLLYYFCERHCVIVLNSRIQSVGAYGYNITVRSMRNSDEHVHKHTENIYSYILSFHPRPQHYRILSRYLRLVQSLSFHLCFIGDDINYYVIQARFPSALVPSIVIYFVRSMFKPYLNRFFFRNNSRSIIPHVYYYLRAVRTTMCTPHRPMLFSEIIV